MSVVVKALPVHHVAYMRNVGPYGANGFSADGAVNVPDIEGGKYAMNSFTCTADVIGSAWEQMFSVWLPQSGFQPDHRLCFELYRGEFHDPKTGPFTCDLCLPVRPL